MKRKATDKPKLSAEQGFNALFKKKKKEVKIEATIDLCDSDEENQPVKSEASKTESQEPIIKIEPPKSSVQNSEKDEDNEKEIQIETQETEEEKFNATAMVTVVRLLLSSVLKSKSKQKLLDKDTISIIKKMNDFDDTSLDGLLRWYRRRQGWREKMKYISDSINNELIETKMIEIYSEKEENNFEQNLRTLNKGELYAVATRMNIEKKHRKSMDILRQKMMHDYQTFTKSNFGAKSPSQRLAAHVHKQLLGSRFRLAQNVQCSLDKLILAYSPTLIVSNSAGSDGQVPGSAAMSEGRGIGYNANLSLGQDFLSGKTFYLFIICQFILAISRYGVKKDLPDITPTDLIATSEELNLLRELICVKYTCISLKEEKRFDELASLGEKQLEAFIEFRDENELYELNEKLVSYLRRYTVTGQYIKIMKYYIDALERNKNYEKANQVLQMLIDTNLAPHRHGQWWLRLIINSGHLKSERIIEVFEKAQTDKNINEPERFDILERMEKHLPSNKSRKKDLVNWETRKETGKRLSMETENIRDRKMWVHEGQFVSVEKLVIELSMKKMKFDLGQHSEQRLFSTILSLLLCEQIMDTSVPNVYQVIL